MGYRCFPHFLCLGEIDGCRTAYMPVNNRITTGSYSLPTRFCIGREVDPRKPRDATNGAPEVEDLLVVIALTLFMDKKVELDAVTIDGSVERHDHGLGASSIHSPHHMKNADGHSFLLPIAPSDELIYYLIVADACALAQAAAAKSAVASQVKDRSALSRMRSPIAWASPR